MYYIFDNYITYNSVHWLCLQGNGNDIMYVLKIPKYTFITTVLLIIIPFKN